MIVKTDILNNQNPSKTNLYTSDQGKTKNLDLAAGLYVESKGKPRFCVPYFQNAMRYVI